jgi:4-amino-4-deoxy-L-arabinose transferase-like glycosyltransferase
MNPPADAVSASERASVGLRLSSPIKTAALVLLLLVGFALLLYKFPSVPIGLHQDEMSEAYESYSLLHTGADRWGYHLPVYFVGWGSGQNVLQAYLSIPVVAVLGLTRLSARLVPIVCGLLTLPLFFFTLRRWFEEDTALIGLAFLVVCPWHIMFPRWGVENSPLPFFMLLGVYTFGKALHSRSTGVILASLLPFVLALYTYGLVIVILPVLLPLLFLVDPTAILKRWRAWLGAFALFLLASLPLIFFTFKNYITKKNYSFERHLPFSVPLLPVTRLDQIHQETAAHSVSVNNLLFLRHGLADGMPWNQVGDVFPIPLLVLTLAVAGIATLSAEAFKTRKLPEPFLPCVLACVPLFFIMPMDMSRATALYIPVVALAAVGTHAVLAAVPSRGYRTALAALCVVLLLAQMPRFLRRYYGPIYASELAPSFNPDLPDALARALQVAGASMPVYVTPSIPLNYIQVLFLTQTDPAIYQRSGATYNHTDFGRYRFNRSTLAETQRPFVYLIKDKEPPVCSFPTDTQKDGKFEIGVCR